MALSDRIAPRDRNGIGQPLAGAVEIRDAFQGRQVLGTEIEQPPVKRRYAEDDAGPMTRDLFDHLFGLGPALDENGRRADVDGAEEGIVQASR